MSKLFTKAELKAIDVYLEGDKSDRTGIISRCVRPKMREILEWFKKKKIVENFT